MSIESTLAFIRQMKQRVPDSGTSDVAPQLLEKIQQSFEELYRFDRQIAAILEKIKAGTATHMDTQAYAARVGELASTAMLANLNSGVLPDGKMYYNIAQRTILPTIQAGHGMINATASEMEQELRRRAGIGIKTRWTGMDEDRVKAILDKVCDSENFDDVSYVLDEPVKNTMQSFVDDFIRNNAYQLWRMGMRPKITRRVVGNCCKWCAALAGTYDYGTEPKPDFYRRHDHCRCAVIYDPGTGKVQNAHSRKWYTAENDLVEKRKAVNAGGLPQQLAEHPARLKSFTPESLMEALKRDGYEVKPLGRGAIRNVSFGDGGGYRVNFPDGGLFQYHPADHSHHDGPYYKISTGRGGIHHYGLDGKEID